MQVVRCARGETGEAAIRGGRRTVPLGPVGALDLLLRPRGGRGRAAAGERGRRGAGTSSGARAALNAIGVATELDYERERAAEPPG